MSDKAIIIKCQKCGMVECIDFKPGDDYMPGTWNDGKECLEMPLGEAIAAVKEAQASGKVGVCRCNVPTIEQVAWVFEHLREHLELGGSFRKLIYDRMGFGPEAYLRLYYAGGMIISNKLNETDKAEKARTA